MLHFNYIIIELELASCSLDVLVFKGFPLQYLNFFLSIDDFVNALGELLISKALFSS